MHRSSEPWRHASQGRRRPRDRDIRRRSSSRWHPRRCIPRRCHTPSIEARGRTRDDRGARAAEGQRRPGRRRRGHRRPNAARPSPHPTGKPTPRPRAPRARSRGAWCVPRTATGRRRRCARPGSASCVCWTRERLSENVAPVRRRVEADGKPRCRLRRRRIVLRACHDDHEPRCAKACQAGHARHGAPASTRRTTQRPFSHAGFAGCGQPMVHCARRPLQAASSRARAARIAGRSAAA